MSLSVQHISYKEESEEKYLFACSLAFLSDQIRRIEQKLTVRIDQEIMQSFYKQQDAKVSGEKTLQEIKFRAFHS